MTEVQLTVADTDTSDMAQGIARVDPHTTAQLGINFGDPILLEGDGVTAATAWRATPDDWRSNTIYIDQYTRQNIGVEIGATITITDYDMRSAQQVVLAAAEESIETITHSPRQIANELPDRPVVPGTLCPIRLTDPDTGQPFALRTYVVATAPDDAVIITSDTQIDLEVVPEDAPEDACEMTATQSPGTAEQASFPQTREQMHEQAQSVSDRVKTALQSIANRIQSSEQRRL